MMMIRIVTLWMMMRTTKIMITTNPYNILNEAIPPPANTKVIVIVVIIFFFFFISVHLVLVLVVLMNNFKSTSIPFLSCLHYHLCTIMLLLLLPEQGLVDLKFLR